MIVGMGIDLVELERIRKSFERYGLHFASKFLTENEIKNIPVQPAPYLASRFAAKEACVKALGTGFASGITPLQIEVCTNQHGAPFLQLNGNARLKAQMLDVKNSLLSITHERSMACAIVILEN